MLKSKVQCVNRLLKMSFPEKLQFKLKKRIEDNSLREVTEKQASIDFSSNDYLGFAQSEDIYTAAHDYVLTNNLIANGSTGSRLITGNHCVYSLLEKKLKIIHQSEAALVFNSGYDANLGLFSSILQRNDRVIFDKLSHASIRDGIKLSDAKSTSFNHNSIDHLEQKLIKYSDADNKHEVYVVTESVFSMDGDSPDLKAIAQLCKKYQARLIVDEAHAIGVYGYGLIQQLNLVDYVFARVITFGKALGCHGAVVLGSSKLIQYLINFSRPFIYTTALPPHAVVTILQAYSKLESFSTGKLKDNIAFFKRKCQQLKIDSYFIKSNSAIHSCIIPQNNQVKYIANKLQKQNYNVKAILAPTVLLGQERLRFCLHTENSFEEINHVLSLLNSCLKESL